MKYLTNLFYMRYILKIKISHGKDFCEIFDYLYISHIYFNSEILKLHANFVGSENISLPAVVTLLMTAPGVSMPLNLPRNLGSHSTNPCVVERACHKEVDPVNQGLHLL